MRIAVDVRYLSHGLVGGVHSYALNLYEAILAEDRGNDYLLWADTKAPFELTRLPANAELRTLPWDGAISSIRNDRTIGRAMVRAGADIAHFPANVGIAPGWLPRIVTLHDAINLLPLREIVRGHRHTPSTILKMSYLHELTRRSMLGNPTVITVSEYSKREILRHSNLKADAVHVVASAPRAEFRRLSEPELSATRQQLGLRRSVVLADAIKNPLATLRAYRSLRQELRDETSLVWFARRRPDEVVVQSAFAGESVLVERPPLDQLVKLYNLADAFVFPSWYEGFGLPVLEAMACGAPVVASDRGSIPEVAGGVGIIVGADDHRAITGALTRMLIDERYREHLRHQGLAWSSRFTWNATARQVISIYEETYRRATSPASAVRLAAV